MNYTINTRIKSFDEIDWINIQNLIGGKVTILFCYNNQITSFQYLPDSITELYCTNNLIKSIKDVLKKMIFIKIG